MSESREPETMPLSPSPPPPLPWAWEEGARLPGPSFRNLLTRLPLAIFPGTLAGPWASSGGSAGWLRQWASVAPEEGGSSRAASSLWFQEIRVPLALIPWLGDTGSSRAPSRAASLRGARVHRSSPLHSLLTLRSVTPPSPHTWVTGLVEPAALIDLW